MNDYDRTLIILTAHASGHAELEIRADAAAGTDKSFTSPLTAK